MSSVGAPIQQNPATFDFERLDQDCALHTLGFLDTKELGLLNRVVNSRSKAFSPHNIAIETSCRLRCIDEGLSISPPVTCKDLLLKKFPNAIGPGFWREYFGEVEDAPSIPESFLAKAPLAGFNLIYIPEYVTIDVGADSPLVLDESNAVHGKRARLIEAPERVPREPRKIRVPLTLQNIVFLVQKCLKKNLPYQFADVSWTGKDLINGHEDVGINRSRWSYQKKEPSYLDEAYNSIQENGEWIKGQKELAQDDGLKIVPLLDRFIFGVCQYAKMGKLSKEYFERTSTQIPGEDGNTWQLSVWWNVSGPSFCPTLYLSNDEEEEIGVAVGVPDESSQPASH